MRKEPIVTGEYYHVFSRGTDRRLTYYDDDDRERFVRGMIVFNTTDRKPRELRYVRVRPERSLRPLVRVMSYALMPNHHHFLVEQVVEGGLALFMQRLGAGYACYFNRRHNRTGCLWESEYKAVRIETDAQLLHISRYIHLNPLKLFIPDWKDNGVPDWQIAQTVLLSYPWSSYRHFLELEHDSVVDTGALLNLFKNSNEYENFMREWVLITAPQAP